MGEEDEEPTSGKGGLESGGRKTRGWENLFHENARNVSSNEKWQVDQVIKRNENL